MDKEIQNKDNPQNLKLLRHLMVSSIQELTKNNPNINANKIEETNKIKPKMRYPARKRFLSIEEFKEFQSFCSALKRKRYDIFFKILLYTGVKTNILLKAKWSDIDFDTGAWLVDENSHKQRDDYVIYLATQIKDLLPELYHLNKAEHINYDNDYLFPSYRLQKHVTHACMNVLWRKMQKLIPDIHISDLRHTFEHYAIKQKVPPHVLHKMLGYSYRIYNFSHTAYDNAEETQQAWQIMGNYMDKLLYE